jgi:hypothetical protein
MEAIALHCVICFEEFSQKERPPVVLPCGHTYVCLVCSKRLKRCMECREPLFWKPETPPNHAAPVIGANNMNMNMRSPHLRYVRDNRGRYVPAPPTPPHPSIMQPYLQEPLPLPIPKNLVLLGMIESAEMQAQLRKNAQCMHPNDDASNAPEEDDEPKLDRSVVIEALTSSCGTYAVRENEGLAVLPFDPNREHHVDSMKGSEEEKKVEEPREPFSIEAGKTIQVVSVDEGVYKLARGTGYIVASSNQLFKGTSFACVFFIP